MSANNGKSWIIWAIILLENLIKEQLAGNFGKWHLASRRWAFWTSKSLEKRWNSRNKSVFSIKCFWIMSSSFQKQKKNLWPFVIQRFEKMDSDTIKRVCNVATVISIGISLSHMPRTWLISKQESCAYVINLLIVSIFHIWYKSSGCYINFLELARGWQN